MRDYDIYQSGGCTFYPDCLQCPFPECLWDIYPSVLSELRKAEAKELAEQGKSVSEIAKVMALSKQQIRRYLSNISLLTT